MLEKVGVKPVFTFLEVTISIQKTLAETYKSSFWVKAEMNKLNFYLQSGHCYPDLVEKEDGKVIVQIRANFRIDVINKICYIPMKFMLI